MPYIIQDIIQPIIQNIVAKIGTVYCYAVPIPTSRIYASLIIRARSACSRMFISTRALAANHIRPRIQQ